ncbi:MAG: hypothetical protein ACLFVQ_08150 [Chitinispirillaceae bacterium]
MVYTVQLISEKSSHIELDEVVVHLKSSPYAKEINPRISAYSTVNRLDESTFKVTIPLSGYDMVEMNRCVEKAAYSPESAIEAFLSNACADSLIFTKLPADRYYLQVKLIFSTKSQASFPGNIVFSDEIGSLGLSKLKEL